MARQNVWPNILPLTFYDVTTGYHKGNLHDSHAFIETEKGNFAEETGR
jgi:hypothetical protein